MTQTSLKKQSGLGYTVLPNRIIDLLLKSATKYAADTLALALYLVRHIPGQHGTLILTGPFSQATICEDLGWGKTNRARLKRAMTELEQAGVVESELQTNNTLLLHIKAVLDQIPGESKSALPHLPDPLKDSLQAGGGDAKISSTPPRKGFSQASHAPVINILNQDQTSQFKENKKELNKINNHPSEITRDNKAAQANRREDDEVDQLLRTYRSILKKFVSNTVALSFAQTYWENDRPFARVEAAIREIAANPILQTLTTSPNVVWELDFLRKKVAPMDARIRQALESMRYSSEAETKRQISELIHFHKFNAEIFYAYYADIIEDITRTQQQNSATAFSNSEQASEPMPAFVTTSESYPNQAIQDDKPFDSHPIQAIDLVLNSGEGDEADDLVFPLGFSADGYQKLEIHTPCSDEQLESAKFEQVQIKKSDDATTLGCLKPKPKQVRNLDLEQAQSKSELIAILKQWCQEVTSEEYQQRLVTLTSLAALDSVSFAYLQGMMRNHLPDQLLAA